MIIDIHVYTQIATHTHSLTHAHTYACTHAHTHAPTHPPIHTHTILRAQSQPVVGYIWLRKRCS